MDTLFENSIKTKFPTFSKERSGVLSTKDFETISKEYSPEILFALETAKTKFDADVVYFRTFPDERMAIPQLYLFDYSQKKITEEEKKWIHIKMWNGYQVPAYGIIEKSSISIFDAREKPKNRKEIYAQEIIKLTAQTSVDTIESFADGLFWEENSNHFKFEESAARDLIQGLKKVYTDFQKNSGIDSHIALKLLVQSILIKYLEERDEKSKSGYFAGTYFQNNVQCENFCDTIRKGKLLELLDQLAKDFNGKVFQWDNNTEDEQEARRIIQKNEIRQLADYLDGDNQDNQYVLWRLYSFEHLPVEVISSVYEELLTNSKDIVYTPEMIVSTLVDECMPLSNPQSDFKMIDVSCGSGIFLVKAYKRMIQWWRYEQWQKTGKLEKPPLNVLKDILLKRIYGVDVQQDAIRLSVFSLALAILDEVDLNPPIWEQLQFPDLSDNIITKDFFQFITNNPQKDFSLIIGNPPFNLPQENGKEPTRKQYFKKLNKEFGYKSETNIPDENPALHFLVQSMKLLKQDALLCLILPSGPLLYQRDLRFKQEFFSKYNLLQIIDFTKLADKLWGEKNVATAAVFVQNSKPDNENVLHLVANRTFTNENRLFLEFDHYDFHWIDKNAVLYNPYIWKANLLGGGRIVQLIEKLSELPTLGEYLKQKKKEGWAIGQGFTVGNKKYTADYITEMDYLAAEGLTENGIDTKYISKCQIKLFERPRSKEIYTPPHILIRRIIGQRKIPIFLSEKYLTFPINIVGISAPDSSKDELYGLYDYLLQNMDLCRFCVMATSSDLMIKMVTSIYSEDIFAIPYPPNINDIKLSAAENIILEDLIRFEFNSDSPNIFESIVSNKECTVFSSVFCRTLNSVYQTEKRSFQLFKILDAGKYYALHFEYSLVSIQATEEKVNDLEQYITKIIPNRKENQNSTHIQRIMKVYGRDCILLIKPKQLRYWLPSIALRDADEVFAEYYKSRHSNAER